MKFLAHTGRAAACGAVYVLVSWWCAWTIGYLLGQGFFRFPAIALRAIPMIGPAIVILLIMVAAGMGILATVWGGRGLADGALAGIAAAVLRTVVRRLAIGDVDPRHVALSVGVIAAATVAAYLTHRLRRGQGPSGGGR